MGLKPSPSGEAFRSTTCKFSRKKKRNTRLEVKKWNTSLLLLTFGKCVIAVFIWSAVLLQNFYPLLGKEIGFLLNGVNAALETVGQPQAQIPGGQLGQRRDSQDDGAHSCFQNSFLLTEQPKRFEGVDNIVNSGNGTGKGGGCGYCTDAFPALRGHAEESHLRRTVPQIQRPALHSQPGKVAPIEWIAAVADIRAVAGPSLVGNKLAGAVVGEIWLNLRCKNPEVTDFMKGRVIWN